MKVYVVVALWNPDDVRSEDSEANVVAVVTTKKKAATIIATDIIQDLDGDVEDDELPQVEELAEEIENELFGNASSTHAWEYEGEYTEFRYKVQYEEVQ